MRRLSLLLRLQKWFVHLRPATELQLLQRPQTLANFRRLLKNSLHECWHNNGFDYTKQQLTLPLRVRGNFFVELITCFASKMNSRARAEKKYSHLQLDVATDTSTGSASTSRGFRGKKKKKDLAGSPRHHVHSRKNPASTHTHLLQSISRLAHPPNSN